MLSVAAAAAQPSIIDSIAGSSLFWSSVEILLGAIAMFITKRFGIQEWKSALSIAIFGITLSVAAVICSRSSISFINIINHSLPIIAVTAWMLSASYFRHRVNKDVATQEIMIKQTVAVKEEALKKTSEHLKDLIIELKDIIEKLETKTNSELSALNSQIDLIINRPDPNTVSLPENYPDGPRNQSEVTAGQIIQKLSTAPSFEQQRLSACTYLGNFITWTCKLFRWNSMPNGQLLISLFVNNDQFIPGITPSLATILVSVPENEFLNVKLLPIHAEIMVDGRINKISLLPIILTIDNPVLTVNGGIVEHAA
jgi:hypothetical protein